MGEYIKYWFNKLKFISNRGFQKAEFGYAEFLNLVQIFLRPWTLWKPKIITQSPLLLPFVTSFESNRRKKKRFFNIKCLIENKWESWIYIHPFIIIFRVFSSLIKRAIKSCLLTSAALVGWGAFKNSFGYIQQYIF